MVYKIVSGFQMGVDLAGIRVGLDLGLQTGGYIPLGFRTKFGNRPKYIKYGAVEHTSFNYKPRTYANVKNSDATIRFAYNFDSSGEICTLNAINQYDKPYFDVDLRDLISGQNLYIIDVVEWFHNNHVGVLNVAGNSGKTEEQAKKIYNITRRFLRKYIKTYHEHYKTVDVWSVKDL